jgi:glutathione S-transferase
VEARFAAPDAEKRNWSVLTQEARVEKAVRYVDRTLGEDRYLAGTDLTLADISVGSMLGMWTGTLGHALPDRLVAYRERLASRPAYQRAFPSR